MYILAQETLSIYVFICVHAHIGYMHAYRYIHFIYVFSLLAVTAKIAFTHTPV